MTAQELDKLSQEYAGSAHRLVMQTFPKNTSLQTVAKEAAFNHLDAWDPDSPILFQPTSMVLQLINAQGILQGNGKTLEEQLSKAQISILDLRDLRGKNETFGHTGGNLFLSFHHMALIACPDKGYISIFWQTSGDEAIKIDIPIIDFKDQHTFRDHVDTCLQAKLEILKSDLINHPYFKDHPQIDLIPSQIGWDQSLPVSLVDIPSILDGKHKRRLCDISEHLYSSTKTQDQNPANFEPITKTLISLVEKFNILSTAISHVPLPDSPLRQLLSKHLQKRLRELNIDPQNMSPMESFLVDLMAYNEYYARQTVLSRSELFHRSMDIMENGFDPKNPWTIMMISPQFVKADNKKNRAWGTQNIDKGLSLVQEKILELNLDSDDFTLHKDGASFYLIIRSSNARNLADGITQSLIDEPIKLDSGHNLELVCSYGTEDRTTARDNLLQVQAGLSKIMAELTEGSNNQGIPLQQEFFTLMEIYRKHHYSKERNIKITSKNGVRYLKERKKLRLPEFVEYVLSKSSENIDFIGLLHLLRHPEEIIGILEKSTFENPAKWTPPREPS